MAVEYGTGFDLHQFAGKRPRAVSVASGISLFGFTAHACSPQEALQMSKVHPTVRTQR